MCIGIPHRVLAVTGETAKVEAHGQVRQVSLILLAEPVRVGDFLLIQVGDFAAEKIDPDHARRAMEYYRSILD